VMVVTADNIMAVATVVVVAAMTIRQFVLKYIRI